MVIELHTHNYDVLFYVMKEFSMPYLTIRRVLIFYFQYFFLYILYLFPRFLELIFFKFQDLNNTISTNYRHRAQ